MSGDGTGAAVPQLIHRATRQEKVSLMFRPKNKYRDVTVKAVSGDEIIASKKLIAVTPGEMIKLDIPASKLSDAADSIMVSLEGGVI